MKKIIINQFGTKIRVSSSNKNFLDSVKKYFSVLEVSNSDMDVDIDLSFVFKTGFSFRLNGNKIEEDGVLWGENVCRGDDGRFLFSYHEVFGSFLLTNKNWQGDCIFQKNIIKHLANILFFKRSKTRESYYRFLIRLIIQNLLFLKLEEKGFTILSAAAVEIKGDGYVFAGLPGSGKTTIIEKIKNNFSEARILSENYAIINKSSVGFFTEGKHSAGNEFFLIRNLFIINRGDNFSLLELDSSDCFYKLKAINQYTAELPEHGPFVNLLLLSPNFNFMILNDNLKNFSSSVESFDLRVDEGAVELIKYFKKIYE
jgi:hypothetical protein